MDHALRTGIPSAVHAALSLVASPQFNTLATGCDPRHAAVAVTSGLTETLSADEMTGVPAHEMLHIVNRDTRAMTIAPRAPAAPNPRAGQRHIPGGKGPWG
ncbi:MAG TPA: M48 family metalloprotease [Stellaceae bacterium]|nr:M48 family metalloprotease [Stellaceae bacterium]